MCSLGFGGATLGLPFMLFIFDQPLFWLPIIGLHLLFFSALTLRKRTENIDWTYLGIEIHYLYALALLPVAAIGHVVGLKLHDLILQHDQLFRKIVGGMLVFISSLGLWQVLA